ncbi:hypothetical protein CSOJ01_08791 [Colletotrichum sojae]|uniref:3'-5' exonuclease domain-containing protein n=1 Tax=Colletotrichum sojae TaxID=2175907 RepID=A0A8H6MRP4_9PEZI|nr:hypothetical protein CSOJ01_08791 [Colletotrichum sojae]
MVDEISGLPNDPPYLYIDIEGHELGRDGTVSMVQIYVAPKHMTYLVDTTTLGETAFNTPGAEGRTFKDVLEYRDAQKVFFDVRTDSDALYAHFGIKLRVIQDLQLMELAVRVAGNTDYLNGLTRCIENDMPRDRINVRAWKAIKAKGRALFDPAQGGSFAVFDARPLSAEILDYCVQDVQSLRVLWGVYMSDMSPLWVRRMLSESKRRVIVSQESDYVGKGRHMACAPYSFVYYLEEEMRQMRDAIHREQVKSEEYKKWYYEKYGKEYNEEEEEDEDEGYYGEEHEGYYGEENEEYYGEEDEEYYGEYDEGYNEEAYDNEEAYEEYNEELNDEAESSPSLWSSWVHKGCRHFSVSPISLRGRIDCSRCCMHS